MFVSDMIGKYKDLSPELKIKAGNCHYLHIVKWNKVMQPLLSLLLDIYVASLYNPYPNPYPNPYRNIIVFCSKSI